VLLLRPALINVKVNAPDLMTPGVVATVANSAGQMTLYLELWDSATSTILARVMDAEADRGGFAQVSNSVTNKVAADRILQSWAEDLRKRLDAVRATPAGS
jgi:RNase H-fold protein (predicted Holliday junction resolvase)